MTKADTSDASVLPPDLSRLEALLRLAGPDDGAELLARLDQDLTCAAADLSAALAAGDDAALRAVTHVLVSVAGSVGAQPLSDNARHLNQLAQTPGATDLVLQTAVSDGLAALLAAVQGRRAKAGDGP
jgi:HPt (histidine-containing phosphotransfer) domain-containing protein